MNRDEFNKIISEAVERQLRQVLPEVLDEYFTGNIKNKSPQKTVQKQISETKRVAPVVQAEPAEVKRQYVKNPILNQILNETVVKIPQEGPLASSNQTGPSIMDNVESVPPTVAAALTKDYSQLLKLSVDKSKSKR